jgi:hypothetical protein
MPLQPRTPGQTLLGSRGDVIAHTTALPAAWASQAAAELARRLARCRPRHHRRRRAELDAIRRILHGPQARRP